MLFCEICRKKFELKPGELDFIEHLFAPTSKPAFKTSGQSQYQIKRGYHSISDSRLAKISIT